jgi:hypothetical protein
MSTKSQHKNMLLAILGLVFVVAIVGIIGFFTLGKQKDIIQGEVEVEEFRVACKYPGRVVELRERRRLCACG